VRFTSVQLTNFNKSPGLGKKTRYPKIKKHKGRNWTQEGNEEIFKCILRAFSGKGKRLNQQKRGPIMHIGE